MTSLKTCCNLISQLSNLSLEIAENLGIIHFSSLHLKIYSLFKIKDNMMGNPFIPTNKQNDCMDKLNDNLRNLMMHFRPMVWMTGLWYPARVCSPLIEILKFCIDRIRFSHSNKVVLLTCVDRIKQLLEKYRE